MSHPLLVVLIALLFSSTALGAEPDRPVRVSIEPKVGLTVLGWETPTGGLSAGVTGKVLVPLDSNSGVWAGAGADLIGITGGWYHMGIIAGPGVGGSYRWGSVEAGAGLGAMYGQMSTCRPWAKLYRQCMRWWHLWPKATVGASYVAKDVRVGLEVSALYLALPWGATVGGGIAAVGSFR